MVSREELLQSIRPSMKLDRAFFLRVYGYEITWPGFVETALHRFEVLGCTRAREYYQKTVSDYEAKREEDLKEVAPEAIKLMEAFAVQAQDRELIQMLKIGRAHV